MKLVLAPAILALLFSSCSSSPMASADYDPEADFGRYGTFAMAEPPSEAPPALPGYSPLAGESINREIAAQLVAKGFEETDRATADLLVAFELAGDARSEVRATAPRPPMGSRRGWYGVGWYESDVYTVDYVVGTMIVDVFDRAGEQLLWHGWSSVSLYSSKDASKKRSAVIRALMDAFPPH